MIDMSYRILAVVLIRQGLQFRSWAVSQNASDPSKRSRARVVGGSYTYLLDAGETNYRDEYMDVDNGRSLDQATLSLAMENSSLSNDSNVSALVGNFTYR